MDTLTSLSTLPLTPLNFATSSNNTQTCPINPSGKSFSNILNHSIRNSTKQNYYIYKRARELEVRVKAIDDVSGAIGDPAQAQLTWQIIVGSLAGVIPFIVAGIEFSKRIAEQRSCEVCGGSGLVLRDKRYYFRCPGCGGFLPWQSWRRFFSG